MASDVTALYTPQTMLEAMSLKPRPTTFLKDMFVKKINLHESENISIDIERGGQRIPVYIQRTSNPNKVAKNGFDTRLHTLPYVSEEIPYSAADVKTRLAGESIFSNQSPRARLDKKVGGWLNDLQDRMIRLEEKQIADAIQTGVIVVSGDDVDYTVNFGMASDHLVTLTSGAAWDQATSDKITNIEQWAGLITRDGSPTATDVILGTDAGALFTRDDKVLKYLDNKRIESGMINPQVLAAQKVTFLGTFRAIGVDVNLYTYQGQYANSSGVITPYIGASKVIVASREARCEMHYGPIENLLHGSMVTDRFPFIYEDTNGKAGHVCMESSPLFGLHQPDSFVCATVK